MFLRAVRSPFLTASILPFLAGAGVPGGKLEIFPLLLGIVAVSAGHLSANVINDYADSKSGADWLDRTYRHGLFSGSKLIQENVLTERFYLVTGQATALTGAICVIILGIIKTSICLPGLFFCALLLSWGYSKPPLKLAYRRLGEITVFILFGPVTVFAGYATQTDSLSIPGLRIPLFVGIPFGLLTASLLLANELPDHVTDLQADKLNLINAFSPDKAWIIYLLGISLANLAVLPLVLTNHLPNFTLTCLLNIIPAVAAARIMKKHTADKNILLKASKLALTSLIFAALVLTSACWI